MCIRWTRYIVLSICSQRLYLIKLLRSQGMPESKLHVIFVALIISRIGFERLSSTSSSTISASTRRGSVHRTVPSGVNSWRQLCPAKDAPPDDDDDEIASWKQKSLCAASLQLQSLSLNRYVQVAQLSQRDRAVGWVSYVQKWKTGKGRSVFNHCIVIGKQSNRIRWKKAK